MVTGSFVGGGGTKYNTKTRRQPNTYQSRIGVRNTNPDTSIWGTGGVNSFTSAGSRSPNTPSRSILHNTLGRAATEAELIAGDKVLMANRGPSGLMMPPPLGSGPGGGSGGGGRGGGGGGGGGGGAAGMTQEQLDWMMGLLGKGATNLDLPDYDEQFDPTVYNELEAKLGTAGTQSQAAADEAYGNLQNYLTTNNKNAFAQGPPQEAAPGMDAGAMQRMLQSQGVGPEAVAANQQGAAAGNAAFSNLWSLLGANENTAQQNRLNRVQTDRGTTRRGIDAALLGGRTGIGMQRGQAQTAFNERAAQMRNQIAQQEAMANWTRQNQYRDQSIQSLLGLMGQLGPGVQLPDLSALGW